jgi:hypothetical protein
MRGVAAGKSAQRSGAATGGGGCAALPRPRSRRYEVARYLLQSLVRYRAMDFHVVMDRLRSSWPSAKVAPNPHLDAR